MVRNVADALGRIKSELKDLLGCELIERICREEGHVWRECVLGPVQTIWLFVLQVVNGNTACSHVPHLGDLLVTASAYCKARARLPLSVITRLFEEVTARLWDDARAVGTWFGHRTFLIDGSSFSMPDTPELRAHFGQPSGQKPGCGFPVAKLLALFDAATGLVREVMALPLYTHEASQSADLHSAMQPGDIEVGDRGFCSYARLALLHLRRLHGVFRLHQRTIVDFTPGRPHRTPGQRKQDGKRRRRQSGRKSRRARRRNRQQIPTSRWLRQLGVMDQLVEWQRPLQPPKWMTKAEFAALPKTLELRELRFAVALPGRRTQSITLVTTLTDPQRYPAEELAKLYLQRWQIELNFRHLKQTMKMDVLKCKTVDGVQKELMIYCLVYNQVRTVLLESARRQRVAVDRVSFIDALRWLKEDRPVIALHQLVVNPLRPDRVEPRVRKRRPKQYPLMQKPREELRQQILRQSVAA
jgi:hypothetical protein